MGFVAAAVLLAIGLQTREPGLDRLPPPTPEDARYAQVFMWTMESIGRQPDRSGDLTGTVEEFNGLFRILARSDEDIRLHARIDDGRLAVEASARVPGLAMVGWINVTAIVPPYSKGLQVDRIRVGRISLPPRAILGAVSWALDRHQGAGAGDKALRMLPALAIDGDELTFDITMPAGSERLLSRNAVAELYGRDMASRSAVAEFVTFLQEEVAADRLPLEGSYTPWLRAVIGRVAEAPEAETSEALMAGFMALNYLCGSKHFVRVLLPPDDGSGVSLPDPGQGCHLTGLRDRVDLRRHFTTAATIKLISNQSAAITAGEAKELSDMLSGGFDFTDIAANNSGIRLATRLDGATPGELREVADRIGSEDDVIIDLAGIPQIMGRAAFRMRFGDLDSPEYMAVIDAIEARIDRLPIHSGGDTGGQGG